MEKHFKNVKAVKLNIRFDGNGCVNYDSQEQKFFLNKHGLVKTSNDNNVFAKKSFRKYVDKDGNDSVQFKYKVSSECLRHSIFEKQIPAQNPSIVAVPYVLYSAVSDWAHIMRGYCFTRKDKNSLKKKSALCITDAVETGGWRNDGLMDFHSATMKRAEKGQDDDAKGGTSIYNIENVGSLEYEANGFIDLTELQFIPDDPTYDRISLDLFDTSAEQKFFLEALAKHFPTMAGAKFGYYYSKGSYTEDEWGERGIMLTKEAVNQIVINTLKSIMDVEIHRRGSSFSFKSMEIEVITDSGKEKLEVTTENIDELSFEYSEKYLEASEEKIVANGKKFQEFENEKKSKQKKSKTEKTSEE